MCDDQAIEAIPAGVKWRRVSAVVAVSAAVLWALWGVGQIARDRWWVTGLLFYIPSPVMVVILVASGGSLWRMRGRAAGGVLLALAVVPACFVVFVENQWTAHSSPAGDGRVVRVVHWNIFRGHAGFDRIESVVRSHPADLYVLSELPDDFDVDSLARRMGFEEPALHASNMALFGRGHLSDGGWLHKDRALKVYAATWRYEGVCLKVFAIDMASALEVARDPQLRRVTSLMAEHRPDVVVGDFNAPRRSRALCPLPSGYTHAYEAAGRGWSYTWPMPCPVYAIDQCILGDRVAARRYELVSTLCSDHRMQVIHISTR
ncbi:MAG: hypothetical protein JXQ73_07040 [Phycisphaerae bacterium]|nr:hypothetical protein [Phycisphaerae bacterium]